MMRKIAESGATMFSQKAAQAAAKRKMGKR